MKICFIIPSYEPDRKLIVLLKEILGKTDKYIFVVDDGSKNKAIFKDPIFSNNRIILITHAINLGKGAALKTAFNYILVHHPDILGSITLDADGQHAVDDAINVSLALNEKNELVLGARDFSLHDKTPPLKSRIGNLLTRNIWRFVVGYKITDTQTGLRGISSRLMRECLQIEANRYDFEMEMLLKAQKIGISPYEIPIRMIYIDDNKGSHFNPIFDSFKIYFVILRFSISSFLSFIVDYSFYFLFILMFSLPITFSFIFARFIAFIFNYNINKRVVFKFNQKWSFYKYILLFMINLFIGSIFMGGIELYGYNAFYAKVLIELILFFFNFFLQREWVFKKD
ncbi:GtrA family protein [Candidatus Paracaedibacter symbiosus]|uniref:GtrA family protein n=1 Tax=Candidatus Paracaedibacter symbiosus TaxID=244582 RepID=UPI000509BE81|nr:GtrA family protein [Candidatus Paracaedibacter symbiosus]